MRRRLLFSLPALLATPLVAAPKLRAQSNGAAAAGRQALALAQAQRWPEAEAMAQAADPAIAKLVTWLRLQSRTGGALAAELVGFGLANPDWPSPEALARRTEEALAIEPDDGLAFRWFAERSPRGLEGYQRLADALARAGKSAEAAQVLVTGWAEAPADAAAEPGYLERNAALLPAEAHWQRFERLSLARDLAGAGRIIPYLGSRQGAAEARLAYLTDRPEMDSPALAQAATADAGLTWARARWLRHRGLEAEAAACWAAGEAAQAALPPALARPIWVERQILARRLLPQDPATAYALCAAHGQTLPGEPRQDGEFLAGFIALRRLNDPARAERHFFQLGEDSRSVITRARSFYWQGLALAARGDATRARQAFAAAAEFPLAFYGQLAALALGEDGAALGARIRRAPSPAPGAAQAQALARHELTGVVQALAACGEARRARIFLLRLEALAGSPEAKLLVARLALRIGRPDQAVWVVRRAGASGLMALEEGWPSPYPAPPDSGIEPALVNAITRQESNFDPEAVSSANARGLMQLLPGTAQQMARQLRLRHQVGMLTGDPAHNMRLGAAYLEQLVNRFGGVLPFAIAGYNAGPNRVDQWLGTNGDPRDGSTRMLDWMELIPFSETRNYVQRVLENLAIYRAREGQAVAHPMSAWLERG